MRETTYQFRDPTGKLEDDYFREAHFLKVIEDNLVAHARTAEFPCAGRRHCLYHVGEAFNPDLQGKAFRKGRKNP